MFKHINIKTINKNGIYDAIETFINDTKIRITIDDFAEIVFVCLAENLDCLVYGYFGDISKAIKSIEIKDNDIFVKTALSKDEVLDFLTKRDLIGTCESIEMTDSKLESKKIVIPFNDTRYKINSEILLDICNDFFIKNEDSMLYRARIISLESLIYRECRDTNKKANIYKILGAKILEMSETSSLHCAILLDFELSIEILQILIRYKITFVIATKIENFAVLKMAQKFGLSIGYFDDGKVKILSHSSRII